MGQILHGSATTTHAVRAAIQRSKAPLKELAARYGLNQKTVAKWLNGPSFTMPRWGRKAPLDCPDGQGGSDDCCLPQANTAAPG